MGVNLAARPGFAATLAWDPLTITGFQNPWKSD